MSFAVRRRLVMEKSRKHRLLKDEVRGQHRRALEDRIGEMLSGRVRYIRVRAELREPTSYTLMSWDEFVEGRSKAAK